MQTTTGRFGLILLFGVGATAAIAAPLDSDPASYLGRESYWDATGVITTVSTQGPINEKGAFFQSLGTNGRTCATCHQASQAMSLSTAGIQQRFAETHGKDPLFAAVDGANCPNARQGSAEDHSLLLQHGLIRIFLKLPASAQFTITAVHDPYGCAITADPTDGLPIVSVYRRPLPSTNLSFLSAIMFDGRETVQPLNALATFKTSLAIDLTQQAVDAISIHAQGSQAPTAAQLDDILAFELSLYSAQSRDDQAGRLHADGAYGGPRYIEKDLSTLYYPGINDALGADPNGLAFNSSAMTLFDAWATASKGHDESPREAQARRDIAAGEVLFDTAVAHISNVRGLNDNAALNKPSTFNGTCTTCHDTPNSGNHSLALALDIGTGHSLMGGVETDPNIAAGLAQLSLPDVPVYWVKGCPNPFSQGEAESFYTTDPGKALVTGLCSDFNRGKGPILRGLAARAPYFHNGAAANLTELVNFYNERFTMNFTEQQKKQLVAFLNSL